MTDYLLPIIPHSDAFRRATDRAIQNNPDVTPTNEKRTYFVSSKADPTQFYRVSLAVSKTDPRMKLGGCNCKAGQAGNLCYHIVTAFLAHIDYMGGDARSAVSP